MTIEDTSSAGLSNNAAFMDKFSRQIGAFGIETMSKLIRLRVLIIGLKGLGVETAKNLILAGPGAVTLVDDAPVEIKDLGSNFFLTERDIGHPRAHTVAPKLAELNNMVSVKVFSGPVTDELVLDHNVVVCTNCSLEEMLRWNALTHHKNVAFIAADVRGVMGYVFSDFGNKFTIRDVTGENPITRVITNITNDKEGIVTLLVGMLGFVYSALCA